MNHCNGCGKQFTGEGVPNARYGLLCQGCAQFAKDCEAECSRLRRFAELLSTIETGADVVRVTTLGALIDAVEGKLN